MPDFGIMRGFNEKLFGDKLVAGQLPTQLGLIGSSDFGSLLLDFYPNASAAYSVRKLRLAYTGSAIRVRRSSDNFETDINFTATSDLDTTELTSFCSGTNGFVTTWYDQSGNGRNATQTTASNQPQIVSSGAVITDNGKPTLQFDGVNDVMNSPVVALKYIFAVFNPKTAISYEGFLGYDSNHIFIRDASLSSFYYSSASLFPNTATTNYVNDIQTINFANSSLQLFSIGGDSPASSTKFLTIGDDNAGGVNSSENISEVVAYTNNEISNRSAINTNLNTYYAIY
jgi:hypothetical protein